MIKINKYIEIVRSSNKSLSSMSQESCDAILTVLAEHYTAVRVSLVDNLLDLKAIVARSPDLVFLGMEFIPVDPTLGAKDANKIWITEYLDEHGITYTGSSRTAHELGRNKPLAKQRVQNAGLKTASSYVVQQNQVPLHHDISLPFPVFIKPTNRGGGYGIDSDSVAYNSEQLVSKVSSITTKLGSDALVEEYLSGREFSVAILKEEHAQGFSVMPIELIAPADKNYVRILSGKVKSSNTEQAIGVEDKIIKSKVARLALGVFYALGACDYGRIDIRLDTQGVPHFLEANLIPSLISGYGSFPKACLLNINLGYEAMILRITELGLERSLGDSEELLEPFTLSDVVLAVA